MRDLRILVVADDPLARAGLGALLSGHVGYTVVGQTPADEELLRAVDVYRPAVLLWDLGSDTVSGVELMADVDEAGVRVVALVADDVHAVEARAAGALGLVPRDVEAERLLATIGAVSKGMLVFDPEMAPPALQDGRRPPQAADLTPRELEVLRLLAEGLANKAIAHRLDVSEHTVKFHVNSILGKLGAQNRTDAVVRATRLGLILL